MTLAEAELAAARRGLWRRRWLVWALVMAGLAGVALAVLAAVASRYQPVGNGEDLSFAFPGLPAGKGFRVVNNFGGFHQDIYVPPQRGMFALVATITNNGTHPVTIVRAAAPQGSGLWLAGAIRYSTPGMGGSGQGPPRASRVLRNVELAPGQEMFIGFPMRMWPCAPLGGWQGIPAFTVTTRNLFFTHTVELPWFLFGDSVLMRLPGGKPGHKGVLCAPGTTLANLPEAPPQNPGPQPLAGTIIRIYKGRDTGELRLVEKTAPDAAASLGIALPPCFTQYPPRPTRLPGYRVVSIDLNYAAINEGQRGTAPNVRVTIAGPDGTPLVAAMPHGPGGDTIACQPVTSFLLTSGGRGSQEVIGMTLRVPLHQRLDHLTVTAGGRTITVPLVPDCSRPHAPASGCFDGSSLGGPWIAGTPYSASLRIS